MGEKQERHRTTLYILPPPLKIKPHSSISYIHAVTQHHKNSSSDNPPPNLRAFRTFMISFDHLIGWLAPPAFRSQQKTEVRG